MLPLTLLEAGRGIEYVADHLGHRNIRNPREYAQITNPLRDHVFRELEQHPKIVRISYMDTHAYAPLPRAELVPSRQLRQWNALWSWLAGSVRHESSLIPQHLHALL